MTYDKTIFDPSKTHGVDDTEHVVHPFPVSPRMNEYLEQLWKEDCSDPINSGYLPYANEKWSFIRKLDDIHWRFFRILEDIGFARMTEIISEYSLRYGIDDKQELARVKSKYYRLRDVLKVRKIIGTHGLDEKLLKQGRRACEFFFFPWHTKEQRKDAIGRYLTIGSYKITEGLKKEIEREFKRKYPEKAKKKLRKQARIDDAYNQEVREIAQQREREERPEKGRKERIDKERESLSKVDKDIRIVCIRCKNTPRVPKQHFIRYKATRDDSILFKSFFNIDIDDKLTPGKRKTFTHNCHCGSNRWIRFPVPEFEDKEVELLILHNARTRNAELEIHKIPVEKFEEIYESGVFFNPNAIEGLEAQKLLEKSDRD